MPKRLNAEWHETHRMPRPATMEERIKWHVAHSKACGCRPMPATVVAALKSRGKSPVKRARKSSKR